MLRLPDGSRLQRRFECGSATIADLYDWAEAEGVQASSFRRDKQELLSCPFLPDALSLSSLVATFPRVVYPRDGTTLEAAGLLSQTALLVETSGQ